MKSFKNLKNARIEEIPLFKRYSHGDSDKFSNYLKVRPNKNSAAGTAGTHLALELQHTENII